MKIRNLRRIERLIAFMTVAALISTGCGRHALPQLPGPQHSLVITAPSGALRAGDSPSWTALASGGGLPYTFSWDFGGGATPNTIQQTNTAAATVAPQVIAGSWTVTVTVLDASGAQWSSSASYSVAVNHPPVIESAKFNQATKELTVVASDPDPSSSLTITASPPPGILLDKPAASGSSPLTVEFNVSASDLFAGAQGEVAISVTDGTNSVQFPNGVRVLLANYDADDTLFAIPLQDASAVGEPVTLVVASRKPANPFLNLNGVGLTVDRDAVLVPASFNAGVPGGQQDAADGFWSSMHPNGFVQFSTDPYFERTELGNGRARYDFSLSPYGGTDQLTSSGALFNVQFSFSTPGTKTFGFQQEAGGLKRTFYSDSDDHEYFWGNISNDGSGGIPNSVVIK